MGMEEKHIRFTCGRWSLAKEKKRQASKTKQTVYTRDTTTQEAKKK